MGHIWLYSFYPGCIHERCTRLDKSSRWNLTSICLDQDAANGALAPVYGKFTDIFTHTNYFCVAGDLYRRSDTALSWGTDWGIMVFYISLHQHVTTSTDPNVNSTWGHILKGSPRSVTAINVLPTLNASTWKLTLQKPGDWERITICLLLDLFGLAFVWWPGIAFQNSARLKR